MDESPGPRRSRRTAGVGAVVALLAGAPAGLVAWAVLGAVGEDPSAGHAGFVVGLGMLLASVFGSLVLSVIAVVVDSDRVLGGLVLVVWAVLAAAVATVVLG